MQALVDVEVAVEEEAAVGEEVSVEGGVEEEEVGQSKQPQSFLS